MNKLFQMFSKKEKVKEASQQKAQTGNSNGSTKTEMEHGRESFVLGVQDSFKIINSDDLIVVGRVTGMVKPGMAVYVSNFGDDEGSILLTTVLGIEIDQAPVDSASNCIAALKLEAAQKANVKIGTIVHTREISMKEVHDSYVSAIGDSFVIRRDLEITDEELSKMSITDCQEAWRLYNWFQSKMENRSEEQQKEYRRKVDRLAKGLCEKILAADEIYVVFNKKTGEPQMFSRTVSQDGGYMCTPPDIMLISKAYVKVFESMYTTEKLEVRKIENGEKKDGIFNFLGSTFYLNGACGVAVLSEQTGIDAAMLVPKPDYSGIPEINIPVTNPDLMRWMLLIGQLGKPESQDEELIYKLYYRFLSMEMPKAKLVVPMHSNGEIPKGDEAGKVTLKEGVELSFPTMKGKNEKDAIRMFTDWKRLHMEFGPEWSGFIQPIEGMIDIYDCAINATKYPEAGCYVSKDMFVEMVKVGI